MNSTFEILIGKKIKRIFCDRKQDVLTFETDFEEKFSWAAAGDCCSSSWIEHFQGVSNFKNATVISIDDVDGDEVHGGNSGECLQDYFYKFVTDKGHAQIDMRNSSNGYYGGYFYKTEVNAEKELMEDF